MTKLKNIEGKIFIGIDIVLWLHYINSIYLKKQEHISKKISTDLFITQFSTIITIVFMRRFNFCGPKKISNSPRTSNCDILYVSVLLGRIIYTKRERKSWDKVNLEHPVKISRALVRFQSLDGSTTKRHYQREGAVS